MYQTQINPGYRAADEELINVLIAINAVSMQLARKLLTARSQSKEGGKTDEQDRRDHRRPAQCRCNY